MKRLMRVFVYITITYVVLFLLGCATGNPAGGAGQELVCGDGTAWIYDDTRADGYIFRENGEFRYVVYSAGRWSADNCAFIANDIKCGYAGVWTANGSILTLTHDDGRQAHVRYSMQGSEMMMLYDNGDMMPSILIKAGNVNVW